MTVKPPESLPSAPPEAAPAASDAPAAPFAPPAPAELPGLLELPELPELQAFVEHQQLRSLAPSTIDARAKVVRRFAAWLGRPLPSATVADLRAYVASRSEQLASVSQVAEISSLKTFYTSLLELGLVENDPAEGLETWRCRSTKRPVSLLCVRALLLEASRVRGSATPRRQAVALRDRACLELLFATGVRSSELRAAQVTDLDLEGASFLVRRAKGGTSRVLPLPAPTIAALRRYLSEARQVLLGSKQDPGALFVSRQGNRLAGSTLGVIVGRVAARCEVQGVHPHRFRRTLATELARAGVSMPTIQKTLGHARLTMTSEYVHVDLDQMRVALEGIVRERPESHAGRQVGVNLQCRLFRERQPSAA